LHRFVRRLGIPASDLPVVVLGSGRMLCIRVGPSWPGLIVAPSIGKSTHYARKTRGTSMREIESEDVPSDNNKCAEVRRF
jgi:hypothetical protein